jgi:tetratricopeptide (TPR) repeat protein
MEKHDELKKSVRTGGSASPDPRVEITRAEYLGAMKADLRNGERNRAYGVAKEAVEKYPGDPIILSYYGYLMAVVDLKYRTGIETCKRALALLAKKALFGEENLYATIYLTLGRIYLAAGMKEDAINALKTGLKYDSNNNDLQKEVRGLGVRKKVPVQFLDRSNPINKYLGMVLYRTRKGPDGGQRSRGRGPGPRGK